MSLELDVPTIALLFLKLTKERRNMLLCLLDKQEKYGEIFPAKKHIAQYAKVQKRAIRRFFNQDPIAPTFIEIERRSKRGRNTSNKYTINSNLIVAMKWLKFKGLQYAKTHRHESIFSSIKKEFERPPSYKDSSSFKGIKETNKESGQFFGSLGKIGINLKTKLYLSRFSTSIQEEAIEIARKAHYAGKIKVGLEQFIVGTAKNIRLKRQNL